MTAGDPSPPAVPLVDHLALGGGGDTFVWEPRAGERRVFGGMLVAHSLAASQATVGADRRPHSLHASFLSAADGREALRYVVERTRDGSSFTTRRVTVHQDDRIVLVATTSFSVDEDGPLYQHPAPVGVPSPQQCDVGRYDGPYFESRDVPPGAVTGPEHSRLAWFRSRHQLPDDPAVREQALAYVSDHGPTRAVRQPHLDHPGLEQRMSVSLDHTIWFHRPLRTDGWLLSALTPVVTGSGRGLAVGAIRSADGTVLATVAQEALLRLPG